MKKFNLVISLVSLIVCFNLSSVSANDNQEELVIPPEVQTQNNLILEEKFSDMENYMKVKSNQRIAGSRYLNVSAFKQDNSYFCGPASAQMVIHYLTSTKYSQSTLASSMGTTSASGTYVYKMAAELKSRTGKPYAYTTTSQKNLGNALIYSIDQNMPLVFHVNTKTLNSNYSFSNGHYVVGNGYSYGASGSSGYSNVNYIDPWYQQGIHGHHTNSINTMISAVNKKMVIIFGN